MHSTHSTSGGDAGEQKPRRTGRLILAAIASVFLTAASATEAQARAPAKFREDRIIVRLKPDRDIEALHRTFGTRTQRAHRMGARGRLDVVKLPGFAKLEKVLASYRSNDAVAYAEPDYIMEAQIEPNDFRFWDGSLWHLRNKGIYGGVVGADMDAMNGWDIQHDASNIIVAVIDSGVRYTHEDLVANMWVNPGESGLDAQGRNKGTNGIDDDNNGYVDDVHGINARNGSGNPMDDWGHGTHIAAIIGAASNNGIGVTGVAWKVQLMACKFLDPSGNGSISDAIECINYARAKGARIINASWGGYSFNSQALRDAIQTLRDEGIVFVAAAGNNRGDNDANPLFPASYPHDNIISVAALDRADKPASFTNFGRTTVDIAAGGAPVFSAWAGSNSDYRYHNGTSMAAPQLVGTVALMMARSSALTHQQIIKCIIDTADPVPEFQNKLVSNGRVNLRRALATVTPPPPPAEEPPPPPPDDEEPEDPPPPPPDDEEPEDPPPPPPDDEEPEDPPPPPPDDEQPDDPPPPPPDDEEPEDPPPPPPPPVQDIIWVDDSIPVGAWTSTAGGDVWNWVTSNPIPHSGTKAHQSAVRVGYHDHTFQKATATLAVQPGDTLFVYVHIDPANPPREIMLSWNNGNWEHRAFWGEDLINYGKTGTASRRHMGPLPPAGQWIRLEVPAAQVGLEGSVVHAMSFSLFDGSVTWDAAGRKPAQ